MPCVNHPESPVQSYCQNCGKPLCAQCVRTSATGQILCEPCLVLAGSDPSQHYWQQAANAWPVPPRGVPNPSAAAVLGLIPGVGAMYNGQLFKGLIHVVVFAVLVSITENYGVFGIFVGAWVLYQSFEAFHTAKARRDGTPLPDPFGLNEVGSWLNLGGHPRARGWQPSDPQNSAGPNPGFGPGFTPGPVPGQAANPAAPGYADPIPPATGTSIPGAAPFQSPFQSPPSWSAEAGGAVPPPYAPPYAGPYAGPDPYPGQYTSQYPGAWPGQYGPGPYPPGDYSGVIPPMPPMPPGPPFGWRRREPAWAIILIILGVLFLLKSLGFVGHLFHFAWPVLLIGFGIWLIVRRVGFPRSTPGGPK